MSDQHAEVASALRQIANAIEEFPDCSVKADITVTTWRSVTKEEIERWASGPSVWPDPTSQDRSQKTKFVFNISPEGQ